MNKLLTWVFICLMVGKTLQNVEENAKTKRTVPSVLVPKTFKGNSNSTDGNHSLQLPPSLDVSPDDPAVAYTSGVLSTRVIPSAYGLAMALGIPSNIYMLVFLKARTRVRSFSMALLYLSLALSDLFLLLSLAPRLHYHLNGNDWVFGETACQLVTACFYGNIYCSAHTMACVSVKRYLAVVRPFLYRRLPKRAWALGSCLAVWSLFGVAVVPEFLVRQSYRLPLVGVTTCHDVLPLGEASHAMLVPYRLALVCLGFLVPFLVCVCAHVAVVWHLSQSGCDWVPFIRVSTLVFIIFVVCFAPGGILHIAHYVRLFYSGKDGLYLYYSAAVCLCCFHSCLDPFLCVLMSKTTASKLRLVSLRRKPHRTDVLG